MRRRPNVYALRPATRAESDALFAIHREALGVYVEQTWGPWDDARQRDYWGEHWPSTRQVILVDDELAGFLDVEPRAGAVHVGNIELSPAVQGRGIGTAILRAVQADAKAENKSVGLQVLKVNPARRLYVRLGFKDVGETETHFQMEWRG
jgi:ribosomal protein S18 acetylase RimI-like enzyme